MKSTYIKLTALVLCLLTFGTANSQITRSDYFMKSSYLRSSMNPAFRPNQGYLVLPLTPNIGTSLQTNTLNLDNLTYKLANGTRGTFMHKDVSADEFLSNMKDDNFLNMDVNYKLFALGFYKYDNFFTIDLGIRAHADANIPKSVFRMMKVGFDNNEEPVKYDLQDLSASATSFAELGVGFSKPLMDNNLVVGTKVKFLVGAGDFDLDAKELGIEIGPDMWRTKSHVVFQGSAPGLKVLPKLNDMGQPIVNDQTGKQEFDELEFDGFNMPGYGLGVDIGFDFNLGKALHLPSNLNISGSLTDIGFIKWNKKSTVKMESNPSGIEFKPNDYTIHTDGSSSLNDIFDDVIDDLTSAADLYILPDESRTTSLGSTMHLGAEYEIIEKKLSAGVMYSNRFGKHFNWSELTVSGNVAPTHWFSTSLSYSLLNGSYKSFGGAIHLAPSRGLRLFVATDYVLVHHNKEFLPTTSTGVNFQLGMSIPLGKKK